MSALAPTLQAFSTDRLVQQHHASPHTIAAYRDAWRLLLRFAATHLAKAPSQLEISDLDAPLIGRFLAHLEHDHPDSLWAGRVQAVLQTGLDVRDRCNDGMLSEHGLASRRGRLVAQLGRLIDAPPPLDDAERFARHLATEFDAVFLFLRDLTVDATNWRAEQAIRPAVVTRKVCGGNRTRHGADTQQVLASVVRTARQRDLALPPLLATMLRATGPAVPDAFGLPPPSA